MKTKVECHWPAEFPYLIFLRNPRGGWEYHSRYEDEQEARKIAKKFSIDKQFNTVYFENGEEVKN